jgi:trigger factor
VKKDLSADAKVDPERLRQAVMDDLMQEQLMSWLETNSTLTEKAPEPDSDTKS